MRRTRPGVDSTKPDATSNDLEADGEDDLPVRRPGAGTIQRPAFGARLTSPFTREGEDRMTMLLSPPPLLELPGFTLRAWSGADAAPLRAALEASDAHLRAWTPWVVDGRVPGVPLEERLAQHAAAFANGTEWVYGLFGQDGVDVLGGCGLYPRVGPDAVELGYWLTAAHTGRGLATRAAAALTQVAFAAPAVDRVEIHCDPRNVASARIPFRLGYRIREAASAPAGLMVWQLSRAEFLDGTS